MSLIPQLLQQLVAPIDEKADLHIGGVADTKNPVIASSAFAYETTNLVRINDEGLKVAAKYIRKKIAAESYAPRTWRTHSLHISPADPYDVSDPMNKSILNWIFLISALNFSFWSEKEGQPDCYGVEWQDGWDSTRRKVWTGYWSLVAALNRAMADDDIPITDPNFYSSESLCPDSLIEYIFRPVDQSSETIPLLQQRITIMREVGFVLCNSFGGSFQGFIDEFHRRYNGEGTALELVQMVTDMFPSFRDEVYYEGQKICLWKRAQILVAETWAAFFPASPSSTHPIFPGACGPQIHKLTMFADYRVPQILHHLRILNYPPHLVRMLHARTYLQYGCKEELSLRSASIIAVERLRDEILKLKTEEIGAEDGQRELNSVLIDFFLWDLAKRVESGQEKIEDIETAELVPTHRMRSIWY